MKLTEKQNETELTENIISSEFNHEDLEKIILNKEKLFGFPDLPDQAELVCFSHLRWDFVFQRPQHLLTRFAKKINVYFIEEPIFGQSGEKPGLGVSKREDNLTVITPMLPSGHTHHEVVEWQRSLITEFLAQKNIKDFIAWYYTPMALYFTDQLSPKVTVYDCMDELSMFAGAPPDLKEKERELFEKADLVFTGGYSLYEAKQKSHRNVFPFPSSIDKAHFAKARNTMADPLDQAPIPKPRMGFFGVIDERMDVNLLRSVAEQRPDWQFILLGPVVKINPATLPKLPNVHFLGMKTYNELPSYISNWDVAILPFAMNDSTRFISPTKTPEYLSAGKPVVSTPVKDVIRFYGENGLVHIAGDSQNFIKSVEAALLQQYDEKWLEKVDRLLANHSWDNTWAKMTHLICEQWINK